MVTTKMQQPLLITTGEPAGIGPDIILQLWNKQPTLFDSGNLHVIADKNLLVERAKKLGISYNSNAFPVIHIPLDAPCQPGVLSTQNANYVMKMLSRATALCMDKTYAGMITGPIHKAIINDAGYPLKGHTDFLTRTTNTSKTVMMLMTDNLKVALFTDHVPLRTVSDLLTPEALTQCLEIILNSFKKQFHLNQPRILICGLNPHAGENGYLGDEEQTIMIPVIKEFQQAGHQIIGPIAADIVFTPHACHKADVVLAMYHDQGLPTLKYAGFHNAINVTLGLPFIRTSVDHGTALDIAGTGKADLNSLLQAINLACKMNQQTSKAAA